MEKWGGWWRFWKLVEVWGGWWKFGEAGGDVVKLLEVLGRGGWGGCWRYWEAIGRVGWFVEVWGD